MKALILAAGLGTRLRPLTDHTPKALVPVAGKTLLLRAIEHAAGAGAKDILINVHHLADQLETYIRGIELPGLRFFIQDERARLLDTGGSIRRARDFFASADLALVLNADIISGLDLRAMAGQHLSDQALVTLGVRERTSGRYLLFDENRQLIGWENAVSGAFKWVNGPREHFTRRAFSGIQMLAPAAFDLLPGEEVFSSIDWYLSLAAQHKVLAYEDRYSLWFDVGDAAKLAEAERYMREAGL